VVVAKGIGSDVVFGLAAAKYCAVVVGSMVVLSTVVVTKTVSTTTSVTVSQTTSRFCKGAATANEARRPATTVRVWRICGAMAKESSEILMLSKQWREKPGIREALQSLCSFGEDMVDNQRASSEKTNKRACDVQRLWWSRSVIRIEPGDSSRGVAGEQAVAEDTACLRSVCRFRREM